MQYTCEVRKKSETADVQRIHFQAYVESSVICDSAVLLLYVHTAKYHYILLLGRSRPSKGVQGRPKGRLAVIAKLHSVLELPKLP